MWRKGRVFSRKSLVISRKFVMRAASKRLLSGMQQKNTLMVKASVCPWH